MTPELRKDKINNHTRSDLVGLFISYSLNVYDCVDTDSIGLYRDDGLLIVKDSTKIKVDYIRKITHRELKILCLKVKITTNR